MTCYKFRLWRQKRGRALEAGAVAEDHPSWVQLTAFNAVFREGSISRAAQRLGLTQPAVTAQIRALEREFGVLLFERTGAGMRPTALAHALYAETDGLNLIREVATGILAASRALETGELTIMAGAPNPAMSLIAEYHRRYPGVRIRTGFGNWEEVTAALYDRRCDVAIATEAPRHPDVVSAHFTAQRVVALAVPDHPLARLGRPISIREIVPYPVIFRSRSSLTQRKLDECLERAGLRISPLLTLGTREALIEAVAQGLGLGFIFEQATNRRDGIARLPVEELQEPHFEDVFCLAQYRRRRTVNALFELAEGIAHWPGTSMSRCQA